MSTEICVVGSLNADLTIEVARLPRPGDTVLGTGTGHRPGGKGANQAAAAARLGGAVRMVGRVGHDEIGQLLLEDLGRTGVDVRNVLRDPDVRTGTATIALASDGSNLILVDSGANARLTDRDLESGRVGTAAVVMLQMEIPLATIEAAARGATGTVILNPAPWRPLPPSLLDSVDVLVPNGGEFAQMLGLEKMPSNLDEMMGLVAECDLPMDLVVTVGADGALVRRRAAREVTHVPAPASARVVDTTGAGDCFCGALAVALVEGAGLEDAVRFAVAAATLSTTGHGARGHLPTREEVAGLVTLPRSFR